MSNDAKLAELRARTDWELAVLIPRELERALTMVDREPALGFEAEKVYRKMAALLPRAPGMGRAADARIAARLKELRFRLDRASARANAPRRPASFASGG
jgi:hypothetical protein